MKGVVVGVVGIGKDGEKKADYQPGMEINGKYVFIGEGVRGSLAKVIQAKFGLADGREPQKFGIGIKELWQVPDAVFRPGLVQHTVGWPLDDDTGGGSFMYHFGDNYVSVGFVLHLNYKNPWLSPFDEFQRYKHHPAIARYLEGGKRIAYGARAITEGGWQSIPKLTFPGGVLIGCSAGFVNVPRHQGQPQRHQDRHAGGRGRVRGDRRRPRGRRARRLRDRAARLLGRQGAEAWSATPSRLLTRFGDAGRRRPRHVRHVDHLPARRLLLLRHAEARQDRRRLDRAWPNDYKPIVYPKPDGVLIVRQAVVGVPVLHQPRGGPAGAPEAEGRRRSRST